MLHAWSQEPKIGEVAGGEGEELDGRYGSGRGSYEPTQADTRGRRLARGEATGADEVDAGGVGTGKAVSSGSVGFGGRLGESGK